MTGKWTGMMVRRRWVEGINPHSPGLPFPPPTVIPAQAGIQNPGAPGRVMGQGCGFPLSREWQYGAGMAGVGRAAGAAPIRD